MSERRYREDEVRKILELATRVEEVAAHPTAPAAEGLTLADIQSIALEVGVAPEAVARAASHLDSPAAGIRRSWGMPTEVGLVVALPRAPTDREWEQLVAELRATFRAKGNVSAHGGLRVWSNGNLHAFVEPTDAGYRLRLGTLKSDALGVNLLGATGVAAGAAVFGSVAAAGGLPEGALGALLLGAGGISAWVVNLIRLPRWADQRRRQMEHIAARAQAILGLPRIGPGEPSV